MNNFFITLWSNIIYYLSFERIEELLFPLKNKKLRKNKASDLNRWKKKEQLHEDWNERTKILGNYIQDNSNILEFGAGNMILKNYLKNYNSYTPSDIVKRFDETVVCDLNKKIDIDFSKYNVVVFSGVLEYVYDIDNVFKQFSPSIQQVILSYCCTDNFTNYRSTNGWLSDYSKNELEAIFEKNNYKIVEHREWKKQSLYNLKKNN